MEEKKCLIQLQSPLNKSRKVFFLPNVLQEYSKFLTTPLELGKNKEKSKYIEQKEKEHTEDIMSKISFENKSVESKSQNKNQNQEETLHTPESQQKTNRQTSNDRSNTSKINIQITRLCRILEAVSISKGKDWTPSFNLQLKDNSMKLWLHTKTDCVASDLTCLKDSLKTFPMQKSWCSTSLIVPHPTNWQKTFLQSLPCSLQELTEGKDIREEKKTRKIPVHTKKNKKNQNNENGMITMKVRIFPNEEERKWIKQAQGDSRWYYNRVLECMKGIQAMTRDVEEDERKHKGEIKNMDNENNFIPTPLFPYYITKERLSQPREKDAPCIYKFRKGEQKGQLCPEKCEEKKFFCTKHKKHEGKIKKRTPRIQINSFNVEAVRRYMTHVVLKPWEVEEEQKGQIKTHMEYSYFFKQDHHDTHLLSPEDPDGTSILSRFRYGVLENLVRDFKSAMSNRSPDLVYKLKSKKDKNQIISTDGWIEPRKTMLPKILKHLKGRFSIGKKRISLENLQKVLKDENECHAYTILQETDQHRYFLLLPVSFDWFKRYKSEVKKIVPCESQTSNGSSRLDVASIDPGVHPFYYVYGLNHALMIGEDASSKLLVLMKQEDRFVSRIKRGTNVRTSRIHLRVLRKRIKNLVNELHWKTISFLTNTYKGILLPEFNVSEMLKGKKLKKSTKRQMQMLCFTKCKNRLIQRCKQTDTHIDIIPEYLTSKACGRCFNINWSLEGEKEWTCPSCHSVHIRDANSGRLIFLINVDHDILAKKLGSAQYQAPSSEAEKDIYIN